MTLYQINNFLKSPSNDFDTKKAYRILKESYSKLTKIMNEEAELSKLAKSLKSTYESLYSRFRKLEYKTIIKALSSCVIKECYTFEKALDILNSAKLKSSGDTLIKEATPYFKGIKIDYETFIKAVEFYDLNND